VQSSLMHVECCDIFRSSYSINNGPILAFRLRSDRRYLTIGPINRHATVA